MQLLGVEENLSLQERSGIGSIIFFLRGGGGGHFHFVFFLPHMVTLLIVFVMLAEFDQNLQ